MRSVVVVLGLALFVLVVLLGCTRIDGVDAYQSCMFCGVDPIINRDMTR